ncbi:bifunctional DNA primase/polymerase [Herbidospora daliensis]|uniref:bifunctional DNA primase/polymerase n=1 Tax=Herbidospora daliensis TaxID=295585 RepID=UPI0007803049|nr:bifunctional DNA primase/polymerase [Herbidospora daliensis]
MTAITPDTPKLDAMLAYAAHGWRTFLLSKTKTPVKLCDPCKEHRRAPELMEACTCLTCHGFYAATTDPDRLRAMEQRIPGGLVAIRTGAVSGIVVVDIDTLDEHGSDGIKTAARLDEAGVLPGTITAVTPSGGTHLVYAHPGGRVTGGTGKLGPGVDVKADGGYFVVGPSRSPKTGEPYRWIGDRFDLELAPLHPRITAHLTRTPGAKPRQQTGPPPPATVHARLRGLVDTVLRSASGGRNSALNWAAHKAGAMVAAGEVDERTAFEVLQAAALEVGLTPAEIGHDSDHGTIGSGLRAGMRAA